MVEKATTVSRSEPTWRDSAITGSLNLLVPSHRWWIPLATLGNLVEHPYPGPFSCWSCPVCLQHDTGCGISEMRTKQNQCEIYLSGSKVLSTVQYHSYHTSLVPPTTLFLTLILTGFNYKYLLFRIKLLYMHVTFCINCKYVVNILVVYFCTFSTLQTIVHDRHWLSLTMSVDRQ
uniref:Uncharacterized protein n=1 Tax=Homalodisca liturata TaxID=320908 RepID=A0A1B6K3K2_9HEMI